jgi:PAS domain S-box-containing protein
VDQPAGNHSDLLRLGRAAELAGDWVWEVDANGLYTYASPAVERLLGYRPEELVGRLHFFDLFPPEIQEIMARAAREYFAHRCAFQKFPNQVCHKDGRRIHLETSGEPVLDAAGRLLGYRGVDHDVTDLKLAAEALRRSEERLQLALDAARQGIFDCSLQTGECQVSPAYAAILGHGPDRFQETLARWLERTHPDDRPRQAEALDRLARGETAEHEGECRQLGADGAYRWIHTTGRVVEWDAEGRPVRVLGVRTDITSRKSAEAELRLRQLALEAAANSVVITDHTGLVIWANSAFTKLTGYTLDEVRGRNLRLLKSGQHDEAFYRQLWAAILAGGIWRGEITNRRKDGTLYHESATITPLRDESGRITHFIAIKEDTTAEKERGAQIRAETSLLDLTMDAICVRTVSGRILYWNKGAETIYGWPQAEAAGQDHPALLGLSSSASNLALEWTLERGSWSGEFQALSRSREKVLVESRWTLMRSDLGAPQALLIVDTDITSKKRVEDQLRQAQKMEAVGQLAGGVAHDFNNILSAMLMNLGLLKEDVQLDAASATRLDEISAAARQAARLTRQLLLFSRRSPMEIQAVELNGVIENILHMLRRLIGENIDVHFLNPDGPIRLKADAGMIEQVIMNLLVNARDAMPKGGQINICTRLVEFDQASVEKHPERLVGRFACLSVEDTGCGMDSGILKRIFEPFFTTKGTGEGTGLGLATVHGIVGQHLGWVEVQSTVGQGSRFDVFLPAAPLPEASRGEEQQVELLHRGTENILLVEDETLVRRIAAQCLRQLGYKVWEASSGSEALDLWAQYSGRIALLFTDVVLAGGMTGLELAERLRRDQPGLKILVSSGYDNQKAAFAKWFTQGSAFLAKPFDIQELGRIVRQCLDGP